MKRLFDPEKEVYNDLGRKFSKEFGKFIEPYIQKLVRRGYSLNDATRIMENTVNFKIAIAKMRLNSKAVK